MRVLLRVVMWGMGLLAPLALPAMADDATAGCPLRPLAVDAAQLKATQGIQSVVVDATGTHATVIFNNGDVLRMGSTGCVTPMIAARLWVAGDDALSDAMWLERARSVAALALAPTASSRVDASLKGDLAITHADGGMKIEHTLGDGAGYTLLVARVPRDGLGASLSMVFRNL
jgi:hypothetical protein